MYNISTPQFKHIYNELLNKGEIKLALRFAYVNVSLDILEIRLDYRRRRAHNKIAKQFKKIDLIADEIKTKYPDL